MIIIHYGQKQNKHRKMAECTDMQSAICDLCKAWIRNPLESYPTEVMRTQINEYT